MGRHRPRDLTTKRDERPRTVPKCGPLEWRHPGWAPLRGGMLRSSHRVQQHRQREHRIERAKCCGRGELGLAQPVSAAIHCSGFRARPNEPMPAASRPGDRTTGNLGRISRHAPPRSGRACRDPPSPQSASAAGTTSGVPSRPATTSRAARSPARTAPSIYPSQIAEVSVPAQWILSIGSTTAEV
jgi:hypothetical protein